MHFVVVRLRIDFVRDSLNDRMNATNYQKKNVRSTTETSEFTSEPDCPWRLNICRRRSCSCVCNRSYFERENKKFPLQRPRFLVVILPQEFDCNPAFVSSNHSLIVVSSVNHVQFDLPYLVHSAERIVDFSIH